MRVETLNLSSRFKNSPIAACMSLRQFSRAFRAETGQSPAKAVANLRSEAARLLMEQSRHPVDTIAAEAGFADSERTRRAFVRAFGHPPQVIQNNTRAEFSTA
jgi:transcriptional regulator GlxA family with amidase domain